MIELSDEEARVALDSVQVAIDKRMKIMVAGCYNPSHFPRNLRYLETKLAKHLGVSLVKPNTGPR
jgi:beta-galactosidase GanA